MRAAIVFGMSLLLLLQGCSRSEPRQATIPRDLEIFVEIDGKSLPKIDAATLAIPPDIEDEHRVGWRLDRLVPQIAEATQIVVEKRNRQRVVLPIGRQSHSAPVIALLLNRKGEVVLAALDPADPFPAFHGRGGNRGRAPGEARIRDPFWLRLRSQPSERRDQATGP